MIKFTLTIPILFVLVSCGQSKKGKWSESDLEKCKSEIIIGMKSSGADETLIYEEYGQTMDEISNCVCENVEQEYDSFEEADSQLIGVGEEDLERLFFTCITTPDPRNSNAYPYEEDNIQDTGWPEYQKEAFMSECTSNMNEPGVDAEDYCSCMLYKVMSEFDNPDDALKVTMEWMMERAQECL